jgi:hypothetical protein
MQVIQQYITQFLYPTFLSAFVTSFFTFYVDLQVKKSPWQRFWIVAFAIPVYLFLYSYHGFSSIIFALVTLFAIKFFNSEGH